MLRRDSVWFAAQFGLFLALLAAPVVQRRHLPWMVRLLGLLLIASGAGIAGAGYRELGSSHSPWSTPIAGGRLVTTGIYRWIRHPIYAGWSLSAVGGALLTGSTLGLCVAALGGAFYDLRSREEERLLAQRFAAYQAYARCSSRFIPGVY
jgi:protein-S-isoprenylcysteine O-methyltransferase Ste14